MSPGLTFLELGKELLDSGQPTYGEERLTFDVTAFKAQKEVRARLCLLKDGCRHTKWSCRL